jgi:flavin-binding protein dodecin
MDESIYKIIDLVGTSTKSWEDAVNSVIAKAAGSLRDLRIAEVKELDVKIEDGKIAAYRARVALSFKYEKE